MRMARGEFASDAGPGPWNSELGKTATATAMGVSRETLPKAGSSPIYRANLQIQVHPDSSAKPCIVSRETGSSIHKAFCTEVRDSTGRTQGLWLEASQETWKIAK
ncbi:hypothetical protein [Arthrobacter sp. MMS18-M83]|uniref:hypothetical protein n=1 Tax=Arthrobacter sp. MMS18-M83 TaxID=2996261 RepID=UPI00227C9869|nr:hypothetical protein [Arthrobacter sp. MMS18-M83]WAH99435.1 hypothetical protein OW521_11790 [Arthrobacter sp. MMS18-M83]